jgi:hypothetical protein
MSLLGIAYVAHATKQTDPEKQLKKYHEKAIAQLKQKITREKLFPKPHHTYVTTGLPFALGLNSARELLGGKMLLRTRGLDNGPDLTSQAMVLVGVATATLLRWGLNTLDNTYDKTVRRTVKEQEETRLTAALYAFEEIAISALTAEQEANRILLQQLIEDNEQIQQQSQTLKQLKASLTNTDDTTIPENLNGMLDSCVQATKATKKTLESALTALQKQL